MGLSAANTTVVESCEELARPLYAGLDGVQTFDRVERVRRRLGVLTRDEPPLDRELLDVLAVFHGVVARLGPLGPGGRLDLFLAGRGIDDKRRFRIRRALGRFDAEPQTREERFLHDAVLLEQCGVPAAVGRLLVAGKKRLPPRRAVSSLDAGPAEERFVTEPGRVWARRERRATDRWLAELKGHFEPRSGTAADPGAVRYHPPDE